MADDKRNNEQDAPGVPLLLAEASAYFLVFCVFAPEDSTGPDAA